MDFAHDPNGLSSSVVTDPREERKRVSLVTFAVLCAAASYIVMLFIAMPLSIHIISNKEDGCDLETNDDCFAPTDDSQRYLTLVLSMLRAMTFLFGSLIGTLSDKFGRKPLLLMALSGYTLAGILFLIGWSSETLALFLIGGMILGASSPVTPHGVAYISDVSAPDKLAQNMGVLQGFGYFFGLMGGALLALAISELTVGQEEDPNEAAVDPYNRLFYGAYGTGIFLSGAACILSFLVLPESLHEDDRVDRISVAKANPFGFVTIISRNMYLTMIYFSAFFGWMSVGASEAVTGGWWLRRYTVTAVEEFIVFIVALWVASGFGAAICTRLYVAVRGLKFAIHVSMIFSVATGIAFALAPTVATSYIAVGLSFVSASVVPTIAALLMGQVPANEKGSLAGALRGSEALAKLIGILIFGSLFANYIEEFTPDASCVPFDYNVGGNQANTCDCGVETCPVFDPTNTSGLVHPLQNPPGFYFQPDLCSLGQLSPTFGAKYGKYIPFPELDAARQIVPQSFIDLGFTTRSSGDCYDGGQRGTNGLTIETDRQWCLSVPAMVARFTPSAGPTAAPGLATVFNADFGCPGFDATTANADNDLFTNFQICEADPSPPGCDVADYDAVRFGSANTYGGPNFTDVNDLLLNLGILQRAFAPGGSDPEEFCEAEYGTAEINVCWEGPIAEFPGLFPLLYLAILPAVSYVCFIVGEMLFVKDDARYWTSRDELTELEDKKVAASG
ncbi:Tetracycline resistance protein [Durusdinium trenchii]|uniref:Class A (TetA(A)) n=1 Tax=Durusdinium trenchii TaxID=1381693 RepID=A0ABP0S666_9DINO